MNVLGVIFTVLIIVGVSLFFVIQVKGLICDFLKRKSRKKEKEDDVKNELHGDDNN